MIRLNVPGDLFPSNVHWYLLCRWISINTGLSRQLQFLSLQYLSDVEIEEVAVEDGLDATGYDGDDVIERFRVVSVDPVEDVEPPVGAKGEQVVAGDGLRLPRFADHEELGQDGHGLQVDGERPQDLHH